LRRINLEKCRGVTAVAIIALARNCVHLEAINLNLCGRSVTEDAVTALATHCRDLRKIQLCYSGTTDVAVANIALCCPGLQEIDMCECPVSLEATVDNLLRKCLGLKLLTVSPRFSVECYRRWSASVTLVVDEDHETPTQAADEETFGDIHVSP
jgi:F-box/leucine-rich repeat protein 2/20